MTTRFLRRGAKRLASPWLVALAAVFLAKLSSAADAGWRGPTALVVAENRLYVANRESGTLSVVDLHDRKVVSETAVAGELSDLTPLGGDGLLLAADCQRNAVFVLEPSHAGVAVRQRLDVPAAPADVAASSNGRRATVACLWARQIVVFSAESGRLVREATIDVPLLPHVHWLSDDARTLVVADTAMGRLAAVDVDERCVVGVYTFWGNNVRGMIPNAAGGLVLSHLILNEQVPTVAERIDWGAVISSVLRTIPLEELTSKASDNDAPTEIGRWSLDPLGEPGRPGGDPTAMVRTASGAMVVCLAGVDEMAVRAGDRLPFEKRKVGRQPMAVAADPAGRFAYIANYGDDTISVMDLSSLEVVDTIPLGPKPTFTASQRGKLLFRDATLSHDGWYSCHSCHTDGHTNEMLSDNLTDGTFGTPKRIPTLLGVGSTGPWAWTGGSPTLEGQMRSSILQTMHGPEFTASPANASDLTAYLQTLSPPPSVKQARGESLDQQAIEKVGGCSSRRDASTVMHRRTTPPPVNSTSV